MTTSEYDDNRPIDGQDEREQRRAEQERYDRDTIDRYHRLMHRFYYRSHGSAGHPDHFREIIPQLIEALPELHRKEGF